MLLLALAACVPAGPPAVDAPAPAPREAAVVTDARCLDLPGAPRKRLQRGPDGALWLEQWTRRPAPRGDLVRIDPATGAEEHVLTDILSADVLTDRLVAVRPLDGDRSVLYGRRGLFTADLDGGRERPLTPPEHPLASHALAGDAALYTTPGGALYRRAFLDERPEHLADGIAAVHAALSDGHLLVTPQGAADLAVLSPVGALRPLDLSGPVTRTSGHVLVDTPSGARSLGGDLPAGLRVLPGALARAHGRAQLLLAPSDLAPLAVVAGAPVVEVVPDLDGVWALVRHDTDGDGASGPLTDEADLCLLGRGESLLPARDRPRRLAAPLATFAALAEGDLSGATAALEAGVLVLRAPGPGPTALADLHARAAAVHRAAAALAGGPDLDLALEWAGNHRHAAVSWDSRARRPTVTAGGHGLALPAAIADLDDYLRALDRAAALGFSPAPGPGHPAPRLAAPPGFADLPARERAARAAALWEILAGHADRHHHGRLAPLHLAGTAHTIRRGRLE